MLDYELFSLFRSALANSFAVVFAQEDPAITEPLLPIYNEDYSDRQGRVSGGYMLHQTILDTQRSFGESRDSASHSYKTTAERWRKDVQFNIVFRQQDKNSVITIDWWLYYLQRALQTGEIMAALAENNICLLVSSSVQSLNRKNENNNYEQFRGFEISLFYDRDFKQNVEPLAGVLDVEIQEID